MRAKLRWTILIAAILLTTTGFVWIARARRALDDARVDIAVPPIPFEIRALDNAKPTMVDFLPAPPDFRDAQFFHDSLYICGSGGLWVYDLSGNRTAEYLVGRDLPPSPLVAMSAGTVAGDAETRLWIATATAGVLAFDGTRFSDLRLKGGKSGAATSLLVLPTGILLIGFSEAGVLGFDGKALGPFHPSLRNLPVTSLAGTEGDLWVGTRDRGVIHLQAGGTETFGDQDGIPDNHVLSIAASAGRVFVGTAVGAVEFRDGKPVRKIGEGVFSQTLLETNNHLLIGTVDEGVVDLPLENQRPGRFLPGFDAEPRNVRRLLELDGQAFALGSDALYEQGTADGQWIRRIDAASANWTARNVSALSIDAAGKLWIGYFDRGLDIVEAGSRQKAMHVEDDQVFCINRIVPDARRNSILVATANGLIVFSLQGKVLQRMTQADGLISEHVADVAPRPEGPAVATAAGITLINSGGPESIYAFQGLVNNHVYALGLNGSRLLAGTLGGLSLLQDGAVRASYTTSNSPLKQNWISAIAPLGDSWFVGTYGGGVIQLDGNGQWTEFPDFPPQTVINPNAMLAVGNRVFAGTLDRGLFIYDAAARRWTPFTAGLPSLNVTALAASGNEIFIGADNGLVRTSIERLLP